MSVVRFSPTFASVHDQNLGVGGMSGYSPQVGMAICARLGIYVLLGLCAPLSISAPLESARLWEVWFVWLVEMSALVS